jgi:hypothetical protein
MQHKLTKTKSESFLPNLLGLICGAMLSISASSQTAWAQAELHHADGKPILDDQETRLAENVDWQSRLLKQLIESVSPLGDGRKSGTEYIVPLRKQDNPNSTTEIKPAGAGLISLVVRDATLKEVLTVFAETQNLNIVCSDSANQRISVTLNKVSWQDALTALVGIAGHSWNVHQGIIHVTSLQNSSNLPPEIQGRIVKVFEFDFASASDVDQSVQTMLSPAGRSNVLNQSSVDNTRTREMLVVEDLPAYVERIEQYILQMDQPPRQVLIEARILQIDLEDDRRTGVNFNYLAEIANSKVSIGTTGFANANAPQAFFAEFNGDHLTSLIECLQSTTDAKTLASPKVMVVNGQLARIQVGEQLGFRVTTVTETAAVENVEFLDVGVVLEVIPRISRDGRILLSVKPKVSSGQVNPETGLPEEETTEVETDIFLVNGQGVVIGGLIQETDSNVQSKIPILGDLRFVGKLFQRRALEKQRKEIIVMLVPRLLPYHPVYKQYAEMETAQAGTPLFHGPLQRMPRPWEASLPDAQDNPRLLFRLPPCRDLMCRRCGRMRCRECSPIETQPRPVVPYMMEELPSNESLLPRPANVVPLQPPTVDAMGNGVVRLAPEIVSATFVEP